MVRFSPWVASALALCPVLSFAGPATGTVTAGIAAANLQNVGGLAGGSAIVNIGQFLGVDASTGSVFVKEAIGTTQVRGLGIFTFSAASSQSPKLLDRSGNLVVATGATVIRWDSFARSDGTWDNTAAVGDTSAMSFEFVVAANVDPFISYGLSVRNTTAVTQTYSYVFNESLSPVINSPYTVYADISGSVVNAPASGSVDLGSSSPGAKLQSVWLNDSIYSTTTNAGVDVGNPFSTSSVGSTAYSGNGSFSASNAGAGYYDSWEVRTSFTLSGGKDVATLAGFAEIMPIPEPETYALFLGGLLAVGMMLRRSSVR